MRSEFYFKEKEFRIIPKSNGYYASRCGEILSINFNGTGKPKILEKVKDRYGYLKCCVTFNGARKIKGVHRWVMYAFHGVSELAVNHINYDREDNRIENLEYATSKQNTLHSRKAGRLFSGHQNMDDCMVLTVYTLALHTPGSELMKIPKYGSANMVKTGKSFSDFFDKYSPYDRKVNFNKIFGSANHKRRMTNTVIPGE
jgi:hypothetical protein